MRLFIFVIYFLSVSCSESSDILEKNFNAKLSSNPNVEYNGYLLHRKKDFVLHRNFSSSFRADQSWIDNKAAVYKTFLKPGIYDIQYSDYWIFKKYASLIVETNPDKSSAEVLLIIPDYTWYAYNELGGSSFYTKEYSKVSMHRPLGKPSWFHHPSYNPLNFLRKLNIKTDILRQSTIYKNKISLRKYKLLIIYGHDEYWPPEYRKLLEIAVKGGTNLLNISGNTSWWALDVEKDILDRRRYKRFYNNKKLQPEEQFIGVSFRFGGYPLRRSFSDLGKNELSKLYSIGFPLKIDSKDVLKHSNSFLVETDSDELLTGLNLKKGDWIGLGKDYVAAEIDGYPLDKSGKPNLDKTNNFKPKKFKNIASTFTYVRQFNYSSTINSFYYGKGKIINFASIGWVKGLIENDDQVVAITSNAIKLLLK